MFQGLKAAQIKLDNDVSWVSPVITFILYVQKVRLDPLYSVNELHKMTSSYFDDDEGILDLTEFGAKVNYPISMTI